MINDYQILEITDGILKKKYTEQILRLLPEWFGIEDSLVEYVETVDKHPFFAALTMKHVLVFSQGRFITNELVTFMYADFIQNIIAKD